MQRLFSELEPSTKKTGVKKRRLTEHEDNTFADRKEDLKELLTALISLEKIHAEFDHHPQEKMSALQTLLATLLPLVDAIRDSYAAAENNLQYMPPQLVNLFARLTYHLQDQVAISKVREVDAAVLGILSYIHDQNIFALIRYEMLDRPFEQDTPVADNLLARPTASEQQEEEEVTDAFSILPPELMTAILMQLAFYDIKKTSGVSKTWQSLSRYVTKAMVKQRILQEENLTPITLLNEAATSIQQDYAAVRQQSQRRIFYKHFGNSPCPATNLSITLDHVFDAARLHDLSVLLDYMDNISADNENPMEAFQQLITKTDIFKRTLLHYSAGAGDQQMTEILLHYGADPQQEDQYCQSSFSYAVKYALKSGDHTVVTRLLKTAKVISHHFASIPENKNARLAHSSPSVQIAFYDVIASGNISLLTLFVKHGLAPNLGALLSCKENIELLRPLLRFSSDEPLLQHNYLNSIGHYAIQVNDDQLLNTVLEKGLLLNLEHIHTAFQCSMARYNLLMPYLENILLLPETSIHLQTCFNLVIQSGDVPAITFLIAYFNKLVVKQEIDVQTQQVTLQRWLKSAATHWQMDIFVLLLQQVKSDISTIDYYPETQVALNYYLEKTLQSDKSLTNIQLVLSHHAKPDVCKVAGEPLLIWAVQQLKNELPLLTELLKCIHDIDVVNNDSTKKTALMIAASAGSMDVVTLLLPYDPSLSKRDALGRTAEVLAKRNGHTKIAVLLQKKEKEKKAARSLFIPQTNVAAPRFFSTDRSTAASTPAPCCPPALSRQ